jgi:hypothetical protein
LALDIHGGDDAHPFRAKVFMDCIIGECPGKMQLLWLRKDGTLLQRPFNEGPVYKCMRPGCYYNKHPRGVHTLNREWIRDADAPRKTRSEPADLEKDYEVLI